MVVLLVSIALAMSLALGAPTPIPTSSANSKLPTTAPGLTREEGVFLVTAADDGSRAVYFIAQNTRHSIGSSDLQFEQQLNPLWPVRSVSRDQVLAFAEAAPIGGAKTGLLKAEVVASDSEEDSATPAAEAPAAAIEDVPAVVAEDVPAAAPKPVASLPVASGPAASAMPHASQEKPAALSVPAASTSADLQPITSSPTVYVLQRGDNLTHISTRFGTTIGAILEVNGIADANRIFVGETLVIPSRSQTPDVVESPAAPAPIATDLQDSLADAPANDDLASSYTVKRGDSALTIARQFGVDVDDLLATNAVANRNRVYIGQVLTIPS